MPQTSSTQRMHVSTALRCGRDQLEAFHDEIFFVPGSPMPPAQPPKLSSRARLRMSQSIKHEFATKVIMCRICIVPHAKLAAQVLAMHNNLPRLLSASERFSARCVLFAFFAHPSHPSIRSFIHSFICFVLPRTCIVYFTLFD